MPLNLSSIYGGSPIPYLPIDPSNEAPLLRYYQYIPGGSYGLASLLESEKYTQSKSKNDGGFDPERFEIGSDLSLWNDIYGLVGCWDFDEENESIAYDDSGNNNHAIISESTYVTNTPSDSGLAMKFNGLGDKIDLNYSPVFNIREGITLSSWIKRLTDFNQAADVHVLSRPPSWYFYDSYNSGNIRGEILIDGVRMGSRLVNLPFDGNWYLITYTYDSNSQLSKIYKNGELVSSVQLSGLPNYLINSSAEDFVSIGRTSSGRSMIFDDLRIYNRVLSNSEISAIYNAGK